MKGVKGRIIKKLKWIPQVDVGFHHLKQPFTAALDGIIFSDDPPPVQQLPPRPDSRKVLGDLSVAPKEQRQRKSGIAFVQHEHHDGDGECDADSGSSDKENARPPPTSLLKFNNSARSKVSERSDTKSCCALPILEELETTFRRPSLNSTSLFDPDLLAAFEQAVADYAKVLRAATDAASRSAAAAAAAVEQEEQPEERLPSTSTESTSECPLSAYLKMCPPGGSQAVVLYTTSLRGIRKTFEDCSRVKFLLGTLRVAFYERDMSMHMEFREELWRVLGAARVIPPRLFIRGRYIGGADEVLALHEQGRLLPLVQGLPRDEDPGACTGCGSFLFLPCPDCNGSRKLLRSEGGIDTAPAATTKSLRCPRCNENGLVLCPLCSVSPPETIT